MALDSMQMFLLFLLLFCPYLDALFDVDEINRVHYGISILDKPVMMGQESLGANVFLASKFGQQYQCTYTEKSIEEEMRQKEDEKVALDMGIAELLKPLENSPCLIYTKGWWTYEFCFGRNIKQYHVEDGKISGKVIYLGHYLSDFDWNNSRESSKRNHVLRYHSQLYVNGTDCDLTTKSRRTEVKFFCEKTHPDYISRVDETETCVYTMSVYTPKICNHPYLKAPVPIKAVPIRCNPLLSAEEFEEYLAMQVQEEEERTMREMYLEKDSKVELSSMDSVSDLFEKPEDSVNLEDQLKKDVEETEEEMEETLESSLPKELSDSLIETLKQALGSKDVDQLKVKSMKIQPIKNAEDIQSLVKDLLGGNKEDPESPTTDNPDDVDSQQRDEGLDMPVDGSDIAEEVDYEFDDTPISDSDPVVEGTDYGQADEDAEFLREFDQEIDKYIESESHLGQLKDYQAEIEHEVAAQFDEILNEAQEELGEMIDNQGIDKDVFTKTMSDTLTKLIQQLEQKSTTGKTKSARAKVENPELGSEEAERATDLPSVGEEDKQDDDLEAAAKDEDLVNVEYDLELGKKKKVPTATLR